MPGIRQRMVRGTRDALGNDPPGGDARDDVMSRRHDHRGQTVKFTETMREIAAAHGTKLLHFNGRVIGQVVAKDRFQTNGEGIQIGRLSQVVFGHDHLEECLTSHGPRAR